MRSAVSMLIGAVVGILLLASLGSAAPPDCGNKACSEEIAACVGSACGAFTGSELSRCKKGCNEMITGACMIDPTTCTPSTTTTTTTAAPTTTTAAPTTTTAAPTTTTAAPTTTTAAPTTTTAAPTTTTAA